MRWLLFIFLASCSPQTAEDFRCEGESISQELIQILTPIETKEELVKVLPRLKKKFDELANLMIESESLNEPIPSPSHEISDALFYQFQRLYALESGRELIEKAQKEALFKIQKRVTRGDVYSERETRDQ